jgi:chemotaxis protein methyltransferase CheR
MSPPLPYSKSSLTIFSVMPDAPSFDIKVLATDIDPNMVAEASAIIRRAISSCSED